MQKIKELLMAYAPTNTEELAYKEETLHFIEQYGQRTLDRDFEHGHFTASGWVMNSTGTEILLMHHKKLNRWLQPGGHCDGDASLLNVALKEVKEESGIEKLKVVTTTIFDLDIHPIPALGMIGAHRHFDVRFLLQTVENDRLSHNEEANDMRWFGPNEAMLPTKCPSTLRMFRKWKQHYYKPSS